MKRSPHASGCTLVNVAESALGCVAICRACGSVHLSIQHTTIRLDPAAFLELARLATVARSALLRIAAPPVGDATGEPAAAVTPEVVH